MKRAAIVGIVVGAVVVVGVAGAVALSLGGGTEPVGASTPSASVSPEPGDPSPVPDDTPTPDDAARGESDESAAPEASPGAYIEYSEAALAAAEGTRVLFFHAPWCPQCRSLEADILASGVPEGITVVKVDYDSNQALRQQYGVTLQTTVVSLDEAGAATSTFVAYDEPTLGAALTGLGLGD
ncbi:thioredoxin family protein [Microbacterium cremeum]|uniref:thioredoxin family protein n=1 Tax=Microbacterium cremeum TaxID=2782169 RepID=UPI001E35773C|nr:thioredoxin family protein [Microbacterium cremeum]